jgi:excisionase family DNA binding protein
MADLGALLANPSEIGALSSHEAWHLLVQLSALLVPLAARAGVAKEDCAPKGGTDPDLGLRHFTPRYVAGLLSERESRVREMCRAGALPAIKSGKGWRISETALRAWLADRDPGIDKTLYTAYSPRHAWSERAAAAPKRAGAQTDRARRLHGGHTDHSDAQGARRVARRRAEGPVLPDPSGD